MKIVSNKPTITRKDLESVLDCLINDELKTGNLVKDFEANISKLVGLQYALATNSLTSAYHLIFTALQIKDQDEVIIPSFFNNAPLSALKITNGNAVLLDNEDNSLFPSINSIKEKITEKTKAIIIHHLFGYHFPINELKDIAIPIIEDISHSIGTEINELPAGQRGSFTIISFSPSMIITTGNGGMVLTNNSKHYSAMRDMRGNDDTHINYDYSMTDFQGAMGISQLLKLHNFIIRRREIAKIYHEAMRITPHKTLIPYNDKFAYQTFPIIFDASNEKVDKYWKKNGIEIMHPIENPLHSLLNIRGLDYPNSDRLSKKLYSLPLYPTLSKKDVEKISKTLARFL